MSTERPTAPRRRARRAAPKAMPADPYDYAVDPKPRSQKGRRAPASDKHDLPVYDDWPDVVPITEEEVDVFERYFGDVLDRLFGGPLYSEPGENSLKLRSDERLLVPERLEKILACLLDRRSDRAERRREQLAEINRRVTETEARLNRLYDAIEAGLADLNDENLKERMTSLKAIRDQAKAEAERLQATLDSSGNQRITVDMLDSLSSAARAGLRLEGGGYRREHR